MSFGLKSYAHDGISRKVAAITTALKLVSPVTYDRKTLARGGAANVTAEVITYEAADPGSGDWFATTDPVSDDLAESATVTLVEGTRHTSGGTIGTLTDGAGGTGAAGTSFFTRMGYPSYPIVDKIQMSWDSNQNIASVNTFSWQDFDLGDKRFPQIYKLYGSTAVAPGTTDTDLDGADWDLLADVDSTTVYPYDGADDNTTNLTPTPEQLAVTIDDIDAPYRHLLFRVTIAPDPDGGGPKKAGMAPFWSEMDVHAIPEPSTCVLLMGLGLVGLATMGLRRRVK